MRLLIFTQKVDQKDPILGFFCGWIKALSEKFQSVHVVCLEEGKYELPSNVTVYSLGKEQGAGRLTYIIQFFHHLYVLSGLYDSVFVHMNQEYIILGGWYWYVKNMPVYFWRNHPAGNFLTKIAGLFSKKVFYTSTDSFTAKFKNSISMPVGTDMEIFKPISSTLRKKNSICMVGRIAPVKHIEICLQAIKILISEGIQASLSVVGSVSKKDTIYFASLKEFVSKNKLESYIAFLPAVSQDKLPEVYSSHEICVNLTDSGSFDKTIIESAACGVLPVTSNKSLRGILPTVCISDFNPLSLAEALKKALITENQLKVRQSLDKLVSENSLSLLADKLSANINV